MKHIIYILTRLNDLYNECFPLKMLSRKRSRDKKWVTTAIKNSCITTVRLTILAHFCIDEKSTFSVLTQVLTTRSFSNEHVLIACKFYTF